MNLKQARYFKTIVQYGAITAAARHLYISQPSLSQTLRQIEDEAGVPLIDRSTTPFRLTYAGECYLKAAEAMLEVNEQLSTEIESIRQRSSERLRLGISTTRAMKILPDVLQIFTAEYPHVAVNLTESTSSNLESLLQKGKIDLALVVTEPMEDNMIYELVEKEQIGILAGKDSMIAKRLPSGTPIGLSDVADEKFVRLDTSHSSRIIQDRLFHEGNFHPRILLESGMLEIGRRVALKCGACMLLPDFYADNFVFSCGGAFYPLSGYENQRHFYACYRKGERVKSCVHAFIMITIAVLTSGSKKMDITC